MAAYSLQSVVLFPVVPSTKLPQLDAKRSLLSTASFSAFPISTFTRTHLYSAPLCKQLAAETSEVPPTSREEALIQARSSIANLLEKALRNAGPSTVKQRKQQRQVRLRVELPLLEESDSARASLLLDLLSTISIGKRGTSVSFSVFCNPEVMEKLSNGKKNPSPSPQQSSNSSLQPNTTTSLQQSPSPSSSQNPKSSSPQNPMFQYCNIAETLELEDTQVVVILAPKLSELAYMEKIVKAADPRPVLLLNPDWSAEEEVLEALNASFMQSFEVVYSYLPLVIQGFFSKTEGAVLKHVKSGAPAGRPWLVFVKEGEKMDCVSSLKKRPSAVDLENALYNAMAANSPVSKSIKFLKGLVGKT